MELLRISEDFRSKGRNARKSAKPGGRSSKVLNRDRGAEEFLRRPLPHHHGMRVRTGRFEKLRSRSTKPCPSRPSPPAPSRLPRSDLRPGLHPCSRTGAPPRADICDSVSTSRRGLTLPLVRPFSSRDCLIWPLLTSRSAHCTASPFQV